MASARDRAGLKTSLLAAALCCCDAGASEPASTQASSPAPPTASQAAPAQAAATAAHDQLWALFEDEWAQRLEHDPRLATYAGVRDHDHRLASVSPEAQAARAADARRALERLAAIERAGLSEADRVNADMLERQLRATITDIEFRDYEMPINSDEGFHVEFARLPEDHPFATVADYDNYLARLRAWPRVVDEQIANMRAGLARGFTPARIVLASHAGSIASHVVDDPERSVLFAPFTRFPQPIPAAERERLRAAGREQIAAEVIPAFARLLEFFTSEYEPGARETLAASELPDGAAYYAHKIRYYTTLELDAEQIHAIGLGEVARIREQMAKIMAEVEFAGSFAEFLVFLREDPQFYATSPDQLLREAAFIAKTMDGKLPALFGVLPRQPYTVVPVPDHLAPTYTAGRYGPASAGGAAPGQYLVNTHDLASRPLYNLPALTLHEAVPGHHLQIALAIEQDDQPAFRRFAYISAFGEGWGLYAEHLGIEAGIYKTPYEHFGRLSYEMWRACRLVVDTGIHAKGWTRAQAMAYLADNTALSMHEVQTETDRYISWPAQALSYKLGELEIKKLRARAQDALGQRFDVRAFHDAVLANGSVPLPILERSVDAWIARALASE